MSQFHPRVLAFLRAYVETGGRIAKAAQAAGVSRFTHYRKLESSAEYRKAFEIAQQQAVDLLEEEAVRRAHEGVAKPVVYQGAFTYPMLRDKVTGQYTERSEEPLAIREYSDSLLMFLLRGAKPQKYRERYDHTLSGEITHAHRFKGTLQDLLATYHELTQQAPDQDPG